MNYTINYRNRSLVSRNEGKIKSYESCFDVRAWSHDVRVRDRYLREWIKCEMPVCFVPVCTLTRFLKIMTCKNRGKATPRCHPDCKSKVLLESICTSCHAIKECLKQTGKFNKYIEDEDFETSHWPCERCLDALKSIKIFWKIILDKIFNFQLDKNSKFDIHRESYVRLDGVRSFAKIWEKDIVEQAIFIKNVAPALKKSLCALNNTWYEGQNQLKIETQADDKFYNLKNTINTESIPNARNLNYKGKDQKSKMSITEGSKSVVSHRSRAQRPVKKLSRSVSVKVKTADTACSTCKLERQNEEVTSRKKANLQYLEDEFNVHKMEIDRLREENLWLKYELQNSRKDHYGKTGNYTPPILNPDKHGITLQSIENNTDDQTTDSGSTKNIDSEMIITMKNCQNKSFKHVSLLQVLHKTNVPNTTDTNINESATTKEDPIKLLNRVKTTFGAIVKREISIVAEKHTRAKRSDIEATFRTVNNSRSTRSCSTISAISDSKFLSTVTTSDKLDEVNV